jgi:hypothetical protein
MGNTINSFNPKYRHKEKIKVVRSQYLEHKLWGWRCAGTLTSRHRRLAELLQHPRRALDQLIYEDKIIKKTILG